MPVIMGLNEGFLGFSLANINHMLRFSEKLGRKEQYTNNED